MEINKDAAEYAKRIWGSQEPAEDFIQTRKGKRSYDDFRAGAIPYLNKLKEYRECLSELVRCNPVWKENLLSSDVSLEEFTNALEKAKQLLTKQ